MVIIWDRGWLGSSPPGREPTFPPRMWAAGPTTHWATAAEPLCAYRAEAAIFFAGNRLRRFLNLINFEYFNDFRGSWDSRDIKNFIHFKWYWPNHWFTSIPPPAWARTPAYSTYDWMLASPWYLSNSSVPSNLQTSWRHDETKTHKETMGSKTYTQSSTIIKI